MVCLAFSIPQFRFFKITLSSFLVLLLDDVMMVSERVGGVWGLGHVPTHTVSTI
jgi:hypothetical protein